MNNGKEKESGGSPSHGALTVGMASRASARRAKSQYGITIVGEVATPVVYWRRATPQRCDRSRAGRRRGARRERGASAPASERRRRTIAAT